VGSSTHHLQQEQDFGNLTLHSEGLLLYFSLIIPFQSQYIRILSKIELLKTSSSSLVNMQRFDKIHQDFGNLLHPQNSLKLHSEKFMPPLMAMCGDDCSGFPTICSNQTKSLMEDQYDLVISKLQEEETNVTNDIQRNRILLPNLVKKGTINLQIDQRVLKSFKDERNPSNFSFYLTQRRQSSQSIDSAMTQCSQFATYCKSKSPDLKDLHTPEELFHQISTR
jgi:hypothetical protein